MNGQWIGSYTGTNGGTLVIELDDLGDCYEGWAFAYDDNPNLPSTCAYIRTKDKAPVFQQTIEIFPIDPLTGDDSTWESIKGKYPGVTFGNKADVKIEYRQKELYVEWTTSAGSKGSATLPKTEG